jgi:hypothetical protein
LRKPRSFASIQRAMFATRIATGGGSPRKVARSASSNDAVTQPTRLEERSRGIARDAAFRARRLCLCARLK